MNTLLLLVLHKINRITINCTYRYSFWRIYLKNYFKVDITDWYVLKVDDVLNELHWEKSYYNNNTAT